MSEDAASPDNAAAPNYGELIDAARRDAAAFKARGTEPPIPPPDSFPGYQIVRAIHQGGQAVIYEALQMATQRNVAIKVMRAGLFAGAHDKARFDLEVQILAQLNHPNIVTIHDSGTARGDAYFVMDYIPGEPLDAYIVGETRSIAEILKMFGKICEAVNAAHLRGIIHRDLKPSNILIDEQGEPHVLDFGLARITREDESQPAVITVTGQFVGSLPWASPEQAEGAIDKIDVRTDVYSLGVILYQMLTGKFPYDVVGNMRDVLDNILGAEPAKPSTICRQVNNEVETICLKCLSKERERRYQSAGELASDLQNYLAGRPIEAKRDSTWYVFRKTMRRHKLTMAILAGFVSVITAALVALSFSYQRTQTQAVIAEQERDRALKAEQAAEQRLEESRKAHDAERAARIATEHQIYTNCILQATSHIEGGEHVKAGRLLATCPKELRNWEWRYLYAQTDSSIALLAETAGSLTAFNKQEQQILTYDTQRHRLMVWDSGSYELLSTRKLSLPASDAICLLSGVSPDGRRIARCCEIQTDEQNDQFIVEIVDLGSHDKPLVLNDLQSRPRSVVFDRSGIIVAVASARSIQLWHANSGRALATISKWLSAPSRLLSLSPGGTLVGAVLEPPYNKFQVWDVASEKLLFSKNLSAITQQTLTDVLFSPDGKHIAFVDSEGSVRVCDARSGRELHRLNAPTPDAGCCAVFGPDGNKIAIGTEGGFIHVWKREHSRRHAFSPEKEERWSPSSALRGHRGAVKQAIFALDDLLVTSGADGVRVWKFPSPSPGPRRMEKGNEGPALQMSFSADGNHVIGVHFSSIRYWDPVTGALLGERDDGYSHVAVQDREKYPFIYPGDILAFDPIGNLAVVVGKTSRLNSDDTHQAAVMVVNVLAGQPIMALTEISGIPAALEGAAIFGPDASRLALVLPEQSSKDGGRQKTTQFRLYDMNSRRLVCSFRGPPCQPRCNVASFSPDGKRFAHAVNEGVQIRDSESGNVLAMLQVAHARVDCLVFSQDGALIATGDNNGSLCIWDGLTYSQLEIIRGNESGIRSAAFSPDGSRLIYGGTDGTIQLFDTAALGIQLTLHGHTGAVEAISFSPDGARIASASKNELLVWNTLPAGTLYEREMVVRSARNLIMSLRDTGLRGLQLLEHLRMDKSLDEPLRTMAVAIANLEQVSPWPPWSWQQGRLRKRKRTPSPSQPSSGPTAAHFWPWHEEVLQLLEDAIGTDRPSPFMMPGSGPGTTFERRIYSAIATALKFNRHERWMIGWGLTGNGQAYQATVQRGTLSVNLLTPQEAAAQGAEPNLVRHSFSKPPMLPVQQICEIAIVDTHFLPSEGGNPPCLVGRVFFDNPEVLIPGPLDVDIVAEAKGDREFFHANQRTDFSCVLARSCSFSFWLNKDVITEGGLVIFLRGFLYEPEPLLYRLSNEVSIRISPEGSVRVISP